MKKIIFIFFIFFVIALCSMNTAFIEYLGNLDTNAEISVYCSAEQPEFDDWNKTKNGDGYIYTTNINELNNLFTVKNNCYGFSIKFFGDDNLGEMLSKVHVLKKEIIEEKTIFYGIANGLCFFNYINCQKVNIQIAKCQDYIVVGSPIILGAY